MKTYLVIYLLGKIIFTLGPYPADGDGLCQTSSVDIQNSARDHWLDFQDLVNVPIKPIDLVAECIKSETRPKIDGKSSSL